MSKLEVETATAGALSLEELERDVDFYDDDDVCKTKMHMILNW